jgi:hypothetical protein
VKVKKLQLSSEQVSEEVAILTPAMGEITPD